MSGLKVGRRLVATFAALALVLAACGADDETPDDGATAPDDDGVTEPADPEDTPEDTGDDDPEAAPEGGGDVVIGSTQGITSLDPARAYDDASSQVLYNIGDTLLEFVPGDTELSPALAEDYEISEDGLTYTFTLRDGVQFHNGHTMTSEDVQFSFERLVNIDAEASGAFLYANIEGIETPDESTVVFTLAQPDVTFLAKTAAAPATILPADGSYDAPEGPRGDDEDSETYLSEDFIGTGPYRLVEHLEGQSIELERFEDYWGDIQPANDRVLIQYYADSPQMKASLETGDLHAAWRELSVSEREDLEANSDVQVISGEGTRMRYVGFSPTVEPFTDENVRRAVAAAIDRDRIASEVYGGAVTPLYSTILSGYFGYDPAPFEELEAQDPEELLEGVDTPVSFELFYGGENYGPQEPALVEEIARTLNETGLFEVTTQSVEWTEFAESISDYPAWLMGWNPSYIDAEYYSVALHDWIDQYENAEFDEAAAAQYAADDADSDDRLEYFSTMQQVVADEAWVVPLFSDDQFYYAQPGVTGIENTIDSTGQFRFWLVNPGN